ncbi:hypothetical protein [Nonomuraea endophytica]|uniref:Uncharacterized protein n=1 Tax=Nonomuraea endophytica TaxID=714136 RepID=A0A7W8EGU7_9ACTN|nr:hypothetical protein [Nonomuraea endophytica]MBB5078863.1 hypothetical protein [Nonomuraea endophytica]
MSIVLGIPLIILVGVLLALAVRYGRLNPLHAILAALFGFLLAKTAAAPEIERILSAILK